MAFPLVGAAIKTFLVGLGTWAVERIGKYFLSLGVMGVVYVGVDIMIDKAVAAIKDNLASAGVAADIVMMMGVGEALNIIFAAVAFVLTQRATAKITGGDE